MQTEKRSFQNAKIFRILFQVVFWLMWLIFPLFMLNRVSENAGISLQFFMLNLSLVPLFYLNSNFLFPKVFEVKGLGTYLFYLAIAIFIFYLFEVFFEYQFIMPEAPPLDQRVQQGGRPGSLGGRGPGPGPGPGLGPGQGPWLRPILPIAFIVAVSTIYSLMSYLAKIEQKEFEMSKERKLSELSFLKSQVSPHFLLNSLNSVLYLVRTKSSRAEEVVLGLSDIIKYMLYDSEKNAVPLPSEVHYLKSYFDLQEIRFGEDIKIEHEYSGDMSKHLIEPLLLIPFVENAFKHGSHQVIDPQIRLSLDIIGDDLRLKISNKYSAGDTSSDTVGGIGLNNVSKRLDLLYPGAHTLDISSEDGWYKVDLQIKLETNEK